MELLFLLLLVPIFWLLLLPARLAGAVKRHRFSGAGLIGAILVFGYLTVYALAPAADVKTDYSEGDATLRAMLE